MFTCILITYVHCIYIVHTLYIHVCVHILWKGLIVSKVESNMIVCQDFFQEFSNGMGEGEKRAQRSSRGVKLGAWSMGVANYAHPKGESQPREGEGPPPPPERNPAFTSECSNIEKLFCSTCTSVCMYMNVYR